MKILQVNKFFYHRGGVEQHFFDLANLLKRHGIEVGFFSMKDPRNESTEFTKYFVKNINFEKLNWRAVLNVSKVFYSWEAKRKIKKLLKNFYPEVAHLHLIYGILSPSILSALKNAQVPVVLTIHDWKLICPNRMLFTQGAVCERCKNKKYYQCAKYCCVKNSFPQSVVADKEAYFHNFLKIYENKIDRFIAPSEFIKKTLVDFGWSAEKIIVLPHFLPGDVNKVSVAPPLPASAKFVFVGRLVAEKGISKLVDFWLRENIAYPLEIFGDGPLYSDLNKKIKIAGNDKIILHGQVERQHILTSLKEFTAMIVPSVWYEPFGLVATEAWSQGLPIIATRMGALEELCEASHAGILYDPQNSEALKKALHNIQDMKYRRQAVEYMRGHHLPEEYFGSLLAVYRQLKK
jgi:glycosyltransferase involved in cell wall biosynthesis